MMSLFDLYQKDPTKQPQGLLGGYAQSPDIIDRASLLPIGQYEDGSLTLAWPGFMKDAWDGGVKSLVGQEGAPVFDDGGQYVSGANYTPADTINFASAGPISGIAGRAAGAIPRGALGSGGSDMLSGAPKGIRAYHGSGRGLSGGRFDPALAHPSAGLGPHFGTPEQASNFARARSEVNGTSGRVYPVDLDIQNPVDLPDLFTWYPHQIASRIEHQYPEHQGVLDAVEAAGTALKELHPWQWFETDEGSMTLLNATRDALRSAMIDRGIDGIRYTNKMAGEGAGTSYMAIKPGTVRSATTGETLFANDANASLPSLLGQDQDDNDVMSLLQRYGLLGR
jgi:hypothetical protein